MKNNKWETISEVPAGDFKIFTMRELVAKSPRTGKNHKFVLLDGSDWNYGCEYTKEQVFESERKSGFLPSLSLLSCIVVMCIIVSFNRSKPN